MEDIKLNEDNLDEELLDEEEEFSDAQDIAQVINNITDTSDLYLLSLLILEKLGENDGTKKMISELAYLMDTTSFINFLWYFEGQTITVPTRHQLLTSLKLISIYYYYDIQGYSWRKSLVKAGLPNNKATSLSYRGKMNAFRKLMDKVRLPKEIKEGREEVVDVE